MQQNEHFSTIDNGKTCAANYSVEHFFGIGNVEINTFSLDGNQRKDAKTFFRQNLLFLLVKVRSIILQGIECQKHNV